MVLGLSFDKLLIVGVIAVFLLGPTRLPAYARKLAVLVKRIRAYANDAQSRLREEMGPGFEDVDWKKLDPRQYDPRRIIREALFEEDDEDSDQVHTGISAPAEDEAAGEDAPTDGIGRSPEAVAASTSVGVAHEAAPPFDQEAT